MVNVAKTQIGQLQDSHQLKPNNLAREGRESHHTIAGILNSSHVCGSSFLYVTCVTALVYDWDGVGGFRYSDINRVHGYILSFLDPQAIWEEKDCNPGSLYITLELELVSNVIRSIGANPLEFQSGKVVKAIHQVEVHIVVVVVVRLDVEVHDELVAY